MSTSTSTAPSSTSPSPSPWRPKAIVFDLLTAVLDSWSLWDASTPTGTCAEGRRWRERYLDVTYGQGNYTAYEGLVARAAEESGLPPAAPATLLRDWPRLAAWPEAATVLPALRQRGYLLGVVTNCSRDAGHVAVGRAEQCVREGDGKGGDNSSSFLPPPPHPPLTKDFRFDAAVTAEESGFYKPVRAAYEAIFPLLGVRAEDVLFVAGSAGDVHGATDAGMKVVWHNRVGLAKKGDAEPLREGKTLDDALKEFL